MKLTLIKNINMIKDVDIKKIASKYRKTIETTFLGVLFVLPILLFYIKYNYEYYPTFKTTDNGGYTVANSTYSSNLNLSKENQPIISFKLTDHTSNIELQLKSKDKYEAKLDRKKNKIVYTNKGSDKVRIEYTSLNNGIKEDIIFQEPPRGYVMPFTLKTESILMPQKIGDYMQPTFYDSKGNYQFHLEKPFAIDAANHRSDDFSYTIKKVEGGYEVRLNYDYKWLRSSNTKYPVVIDPTILHDTTAEFATGQFNRSKDVGSGSSPKIETYYQESTNDSHTVGLWHLNEASGSSITDFSGRGNTGTATGTTVVTGILDNARSFNGSSDYVSLGSSTDLRVETDSFTLETWIKPATNLATGTRGAILAYYTPGWILDVVDDADVEGYRFYNGSTSYKVNAPNNLLSLDWTHFAVTWDRGTSLLTIYLNGEAQQTFSVTSVTTSTNPLLMGKRTDGNYFNGIIDEVRISNIARTPEEIKQTAQRRPSSTYTSEVIDLTNQALAWNAFGWEENGVGTGDGETLFSTANLIAKWNFNELSGTTSNNDAEGTSCGGTPANCDGTLTGFDSTASQDADPDSSWTANNKRWGAGALQFDGINSYVSCTDINCGGISALDMSTRLTTYSWGTWINTIQTPSASTDIISKRNGTTPAAGYTMYLATSGLIACQIADGTASAYTVSLNKINDGLWHYIVCTNDGTNIKIYVDGKFNNLASTSSVTGSINTSENFSIGRNNNGTYFNGIIDSVAIFSRSLPASEILSNYNASNIELQTRVGSDTSPDDGNWEAWKPTTGETAIDTYDGTYQYNTTDSNLVAYYPMDESTNNTCAGGEDICDKKNSYHGTETSTDIVSGKYGNARGFDSINDNIILSSEGSNLSLNNYSVSAWVNKLTTSTGTHIIVDNRDSGSDGWMLWATSSNFVCRYNATDVTGTTTVSFGVWYHVGCISDGSTLKIYVNGLLENSGAITGNIAETTNASIGGRSFSTPNNNFPGNIDEVRIYNTNISATLFRQQFIEGSTNATTLLPSNDSIAKVDGTSSQKINIGNPVVDASTIALWHLDETGGTGAYLKDSTSNANNGTPTGTTIAKGISGKARTFNGTSDYIDAGSSSTLKFTLTDNFSISGWVNVVSDSTERVIVGNGWSTSGYHLRMTSGNKLRFIIIHDGSNYKYTDSSDVITSGWHYVVATWNGSSTTLYVDGKQTGSQITVGTVTNITSSLNFYVGNVSGQTAYFKGTIDELRVHNVALTAEEIAESYRMGSNHYINKTITSTNLSSKSSLPFYIAADRPGTYLQTTVGESAYANYQPDANTVGLWHLDEIGGSISSLKDSSGNSYDGNALYATGGTITYSGGYTIHTFTSSGSFVTSGSRNVEVLVVGGGGGGGGTNGGGAVGGGGGGGQVAYNASYTANGAITVTVGAAGARGQCGNVGDGCPYATGTAGSNGGSSIFGSITAVGGGGGGLGNGGSGLSGASGGGGGTYFGAGGSATAGYSGGQGSDCNTPCRAGGGGGAGAAGASGATTGNGGNGVANSISGVSTYYGGGAAGNGYSNNNGAAGLGGGATGYVCSVNGSTGCTNGASGTANTGGGGAGASGSSRGWGGLGGSGIVIVRYPTSYTGTEVEGKVGIGRSFNGTSDGIVQSSGSNVNVTGDITVEAWINPSTLTGSNNTIVHKDSQYSLTIRTTDNYVAWADSSNWSYANFGFSDIGLQLNKWQHIAATKTGGVVKIYLNGVEKVSKSFGSALTSTSNVMAIGCYAGATSCSSHYFPGSIDEVRISNIARNASEIRQAYEAGLRSHQITIDFGAKLDSGNLIADTSDLSFTVDATYYGLQNKGDKIFSGEKIIIRENYNGTEYKAQGTVTAVNKSTGAITVSSWD
ncbi:LamG domain-containing protein, partial [Candidatus Dojkabacteria bacterium]|nr:LamG domain-containing protein [Candidatus Dojkabacteria bacterium]